MTKQTPLKPKITPKQRQHHFQKNKATTHPNVGYNISTKIDKI
jgi:hypothetical protein